MPLPAPRSEPAPRPGAAAAETSCRRCAARVTEYHTINGEMVCAACRGKFEAWRGGRYSRLPLALLLGVGAAAVGAALSVMPFVGAASQLPLFLPLTGWMVGTAMNKGARGRGGRLLPILAVALTYLSLVAFFMFPGDGSSELPGVLFLPLGYMAFGLFRGAFFAVGLWLAYSRAEEDQVLLGGPYEVKAKPGDAPAGAWA